jgi:hypothetical protein
MPIIQVAHLTKEYLPRAQRGLDDDSITIDPARFIRETVGCAMRTIERGMVRMAHPTAQPAIADLSGRINHEQGEVVCIVGHNDAGKSKVDQSSGRHT